MLPRTIPSLRQYQYRGINKHCSSAISTTARRSTRATLSKIWVPTAGRSEARSESGHDMLIRAGFLHQSQPGIFHMLPMGHRVQAKIENLLDKHMLGLGASRVSLSSITSEELWRKSGRLTKGASELFRFTDQKDVPLMLSPTHEEEITKLVGDMLNSYKTLPLRLYQITRKYRDEIRPRQGLLRSREFLMKDLYTFDDSLESALQTYSAVSLAYSAFFSDLKLPVLVAEASSGDMGGSQSHEYHLESSAGDDTVVACSACGYTANNEVAASLKISPEQKLNEENIEQIEVWRGISQDRTTLVNAWYPKGKDGLSRGLNMRAVKQVVPELDPSVGNATRLWEQAVSKIETGKRNSIKLLNVVDSSIASQFEQEKKSLPLLPEGVSPEIVEQRTIVEDGIDLLEILDGDRCPRCTDGHIVNHRALELGHTFVLGTRYTLPLNVCFTPPDDPKKRVPISMGCYGIGISRIMGAIAEHKHDAQGLQWPAAVAPYEVAIIPTAPNLEAAGTIYDKLTIETGSLKPLDAVIDDRPAQFGWKMCDADFTGYPILVVVGKTWIAEGTCEVQCRALGIKQNVTADALLRFIKDLLTKL